PRPQRAPMRASFSLFPPGYRSKRVILLEFFAAPQSWQRRSFAKRDRLPMQSEPDRLFSGATFLASAGTLQEFPTDGVPEVAFVGRSNVGKSSAINALAGRRRLAFTAKAPGRTQTVNFYDLGSAARVVDLSGYGFARVSKSVREGWDRLVGDYFGADRPLAGVV